MAHTESCLIVIQASLTLLSCLLVVNPPEGAAALVATNVNATVYQWMVSNALAGTNLVGPMAAVAAPSNNGSVVLTIPLAGSEAQTEFVTVLKSDAGSLLANMGITQATWMLAYATGMTSALIRYSPVSLM